MNIYGRRSIKALVCLGLFSVACSSALGDSITVGGARYKDVLVIKTDSNYYIQIPWEGLTVSARVEDVDEANVIINKDPYYRDRLKEEYRVSKQLRDAGQIQNKESDAAFQVRDSSSASLQVPTDGDAPSPAGGGGGGGGSGDLGVPRTQVEQGLAGFGIQFQPGPGRGGDPSVVGEMADGTRFELIGPPDRLAGLEVSLSVPAAQLAVSTQQLKMFVMQMDATLSKDFDAMIQEAQSSGSSSRRTDDIAATVSISESGGNSNFKMTIGPAN